MSNQPTIGIFGGHTVYELGHAQEVEAFFQAVNAAPALVTDRLYRRYLKAEELPAARRAMSALRTAFAAKALPPASAAFFAKFFDRFEEAAEAALAFQADFGIYQPVRLVIADMPAFMVDKKRPLAQYDALQAEPFWKRTTTP